MNKKWIVVLCLLLLCSCGQKEEADVPKPCDLAEDCGTAEIRNDTLDFQEAYESLNHQENKAGLPYREVTIPENHPFVETTAEEIVRRIEEKESFYVYVGDEMCPWCRSVIEKAIDLSKEVGVEKIYYLQIWDEEGNEVLRDKYVYEDGELKQERQAAETYYRLLQEWDAFLTDYTLSDENGEMIPVGEKRIYAPNFFYVEDGRLVRFTEGISGLQEDSRQELTEEILKEEETLFRAFFGISEE